MGRRCVLLGYGTVHGHGAHRRQAVPGRLAYVPLAFLVAIGLQRLGHDLVWGSVKGRESLAFFFLLFCDEYRCSIGWWCVSGVGSVGLRWTATPAVNPHHKSPLDNNCKEPMRERGKNKTKTGKKSHAKIRARKKKGLAGRVSREMLQAVQARLVVRKAGVAGEWMGPRPAGAVDAGGQRAKEQRLFPLGKPGGTRNAGGQRNVTLHVPPLSASGRHSRPCRQRA